MPGQITLDTEFGRALKALGADPSFKVYVDVGAWNGEGTTRCLYEGMRDRTDGPTIVSFEANKAWWRVASNHWKDVSGVRVLYGRVAERMMSDEEVLAHRYYEKVKEHYAIHFTQDEKDFKDAPLVRMRRCDVAVLDGGEFCGPADWAALAHLSPRVVALDDIDVMKNCDNYLQMIVDGWEVIFRTTERNGAAILRCPEKPFKEVVAAE